MFTIKLEALVCLDHPVVLRFFAWAVRKAAKRPTKIPVSLKKGQTAYSRDRATKDLHHLGFTEREVVFAMSECLRLNLFEAEPCDKGFVLTFNNNAVGIEGEEGEPLPELEQRVADVLQYHVATFPSFSRGIKIGGPTWKMVKKRLEEGFTLEDLKFAIDGNANDKWWVTRKIHSLDIIFRERHLARFITMGKNSKPLADTWIDAAEEADNVFDATEPLAWRQEKRDDTGRSTAICHLD